jgi:hypothetical protein
MGISTANPARRRQRKICAATTWQCPAVRNRKPHEGNIWGHFVLPTRRMLAFHFVVHGRTFSRFQIAV